MTSDPVAGTAPAPTRRRWLRWVAVLLGVLVALTLFAWLALPPLLKPQIEQRASAELGRPVRIGELSFEPWALRLGVSDLSIGPAAGAADTEPLLQVRRIVMDLSARSLLRLAPVIESLDIEGPKLRLARLGEGRYDIDDLIRRFADRPQPAQPAKPQHFALFNLRISDGALRFDDQPVARVHDLHGLRFELPFLSNLPDRLEVKVEPRLGFVLDDAPFEIKGRSTPFAQGRASQFDIRFDRLELGPMWAYLPDALPVRPEGGVLDSDLVLGFEQHDDQPPRLRLAGTVALHDLGVRERGGAPLLGWQSLRVHMADVQPLQRHVGLEKVQIAGLQLQLAREPDGRLNLQRLAAAGHAHAAAAPAAASAPIQAASAPAAASATAPATAPAPASASASASASAGAPPGGGWTVLLGSFELDGARVDWRDQTLQPAAELRIEPLDLRMADLRWPADADATLQLDARVQAAGGQPAAALHAEGKGSDRSAQLAWKLADVDLAAAAPYLRDRLRPGLSGRAAAEGSVAWAGGGAPKLVVGVARLQLDDLKLSEPAAAGKRAAPVLQLPRLELVGVEADLYRERVTADSLQLTRPAAELRRGADGRLDAQDWWIEPAASNTAARPASAEPPARAATAEPPASASAAGAPAAGAPAAGGWRGELKQLRVDGARVRLNDAALPASPLQLAAVQLRASGLAWPIDGSASAGWPLELAAQFSHAGSRTPARLDWNGRIGAQPLLARGRLLVERLPVHVFTPLFAAQMPVVIRRLEAGFRGEVDLRRQGDDWVGQLRGDALLADMRLGLAGAPAAKPAAAPAATLAAAPAAAAPAAADTQDPNQDLVSWNAVAANGLDLRLAPPAKPLLQIDTLRIDDYASRVVVTPDGRLNLQTAAAAPGATAAAAANAASAPAAAAASAPPAVAAPVTALSGLPIDFVIGSTTFSNAQVDFHDFFIRPNYSAELSELDGTVGRLDSRSRDAATLQVKGRVAGTGLLQIEGSVNPVVRPPVLDLKASATDIELPGLSPYSAKYAGYPIERGKLSATVAYKVGADGKLDASNRIVIDQLTFGPWSDSPSATKLPVKLAVALLQDANGVIDLDIPVSGSIDDPKFSVGALIWKAIVNLLTRAVTSPFSLLGGGGKDLSVVPFEPGTAQFAAGGAAVIDSVAKAMAERPKLRLTIAGEADYAREREAMQRAALEQRLRDEQRRERARGSLGSSTADADAPLPPLGADERARLLARVYDDTKLPDKPRNLIGMAKRIPPAQMESMLAAAMPVDEAAAHTLAQLRGRSVRDALLAKGLPGSRLFLADAKGATRDDAKADLKADAKADEKAGGASADQGGAGAWTPRARLTLAVE